MRNAATWRKNQSLMVEDLFCQLETVVTLIIPNPPVIPGKDRYLESIKAEPKRRCEWGFKHRSSPGVWMSRDRSTPNVKRSVGWSFSFEGIMF